MMDLSTRFSENIEPSSAMKKEYLSWVEIKSRSVISFDEKKNSVQDDTNTPIVKKQAKAHEGMSNTQNEHFIAEFRKSTEHKQVNEAALIAFLAKYANERSAQKLGSASKVIVHKSSKKIFQEEVRAEFFSKSPSSKFNSPKKTNPNLLSQGALILNNDYQIYDKKTDSNYKLVQKRTQSQNLSNVEDEENIPPQKSPLQASKNNQIDLLNNSKLQQSKLSQRRASQGEMECKKGSNSGVRRSDNKSTVKKFDQMIKMLIPHKRIDEDYSQVSSFQPDEPKRKLQKKATTEGNELQEEVGGAPKTVRPSNSRSGVSDSQLGTEIQNLNSNLAQHIGCLTRNRSSSSKFLSKIAIKTVVNSNEGFSSTLLSQIEKKKGIPSIPSSMNSSKLKTQNSIDNNTSTFRTPLLKDAFVKKLVQAGKAKNLVTEYSEVRTNQGQISRPSHRFKNLDRYAVDHQLKDQEQIRNKVQNTWRSTSRAANQSIESGRSASQAEKNAQQSKSREIIKLYRRSKEFDTESCKIPAQQPLQKNTTSKAAGPFTRTSINTSSGHTLVSMTKDDQSGEKEPGEKSKASCCEIQIYDNDKQIGGVGLESENVSNILKTACDYVEGEFSKTSNQRNREGRSREHGERGAMAASSKGKHEIGEQSVSRRSDMGVNQFAQHIKRINLNDMLVDQPKPAPNVAPFAMKKNVLEEQKPNNKSNNIVRLNGYNIIFNQKFSPALPNPFTRNTNRQEPLSTRPSLVSNHSNLPNFMVLKGQDKENSQAKYVPHRSHHSHRRSTTSNQSSIGNSKPHTRNNSIEINNPQQLGHQEEFSLEKERKVIISIFVNNQAQPPKKNRFLPQNKPSLDKPVV